MLGIKATEAALEKFNNMKLGKKIAYIIFKINGADIEVEDSKEKSDNEDYLDDFVKSVKSSGQPRYSVVDWNHKLVFVAWSPDTSKAKNKMQYSTAKEGFVQELQGIHVKLQATDDGELSKDVIEEKTKSKV